MTIDPSRLHSTRLVAHPGCTRALADEDKVRSGQVRSGQVS